MAAGFGYEGGRVVVTGAASGMGAATAEVVASLGATVVTVDRQTPTRTFAAHHEVDLRDEDAIDATVAAIAADGPIDRVFYCAGLPGGSFSDLDVMTVNFVALRHFHERCLPHVPRGGALASISSGAGLGYLGAMASVTPLLEVEGFAAARAWVEDNLAGTGFDGYTFSKMCTILWTMRRGYHVTTDLGVRVNCISPGPTDTPMYPHFIEHIGKDFMDAYPKPIGRTSTAEEQAWVLAFLNSDLASHVSCENVFTDGGGCAGMITGQFDVGALLAQGTPGD